MISLVLPWLYGSVWTTVHRSKELERCAKTCLLRKNGDGLSAIEPMQYQQRFMDNLESITQDAADVGGEKRQSISARFSGSSFASVKGGDDPLPAIRAGESTKDASNLLGNTAGIDSVDASVELSKGVE